MNNTTLNLQHAQKAVPSGGIILPEHFRKGQAGGGVIARPGTGQRGYVQDEDSGLIRPDPAGRQIYVPRRFYSFGSAVSGRPAVSAPFSLSASPRNVAAPAVPAASPRAYSVELEDLAPDPFRSFDFMERLRLAIVDDINKVRAEAGMPSLQDDIARKKAAGQMADDYDPERLMMAVRAMGGRPRSP